MLRRTLLALASLAFVIAACGDDPEPLPTLSVSADPTTFASGGMTTLSVAVEHFELAADDAAHALRAAHEDDGTAHDETGDDVVSARAGHYHVYVDSFDTNPILMSHMATMALTVTSTPGPHTLLVRLHGLDHKIVEPQITDSVDITLEAP